jgi:hypothetical protein
MAPLLGLLLLAAPDFDRDIAPVLARHCLQCHGESVKMGGLDLRSVDSMLRGGAKGPTLVAGNADSSLIARRIADKSMPMGPAKVPDSEAGILRAWIEAGAPPGSGRAAAATSGHWAFSPPRRPAEPAVRNRAWPTTPIDRFLLARMEAAGVHPVEPADAPTWLRRVHLGLVGLPPTIEEQRAFQADPSAAACNRVIDSLLSRPEYGERWARRWLDVVRYAESNGYERDGTKPNVWRYRDWVINSLNSDKPYDRFVVEQLAGDELPDADADTHIATTFLRLGTWDDEPAEPLQDRFDQLDDIVGATSAAFLGVTLRCARCHDHKFEPFTQRDYYRTLAIFDPLKRPQRDRAEFDKLVGTAREIADYEAAKRKADDAVAELDGKIERVRQGVIKRLLKSRAENKVASDIAFLDHVETVLAFSTPAERRNKEQKALVEKFQAKLDQAILAHAEGAERDNLAAWRADKEAVNAARPKEPTRAYIWQEDPATPTYTRLLLRGDPRTLGDEVQPGVPGVLGAADPASIVPTPRTSGRRLWFARWLTRPDNPLAARVIVNRIWQGHFGEGLVPSENDFGVAGQAPSNPELLDWLATEMVRSGWSMKHIHRLIARSSAYALSSGWSEANGKIDAANTMRWRWTPRRLDAEVVRDSALAAAGSLNPERGGPSVFPKLPQAVLAGQSRPGNGWGQSGEADASRRSVYIFVKRSLAVPELEALDSPDTTASCEQRPVSTTGPQALIFLNGEFTREQSRRLAARVAAAAGPDPRERVILFYQLALGRRPSDGEAADALAFLSGDRGMESLALVLLNSNEFF